MSDLARVLLEELAGDPAAVERLRELIGPAPAPASSTPELLTMVAAARELGVSAKTIRRRIDDGSLQAVVDHGRTMVPAGELRRYVERLERVGGRAAGRRRRARSAGGRFDFLRQQ